MKRRMNIRKILFLSGVKNDDIYKPSTRITTSVWVSQMPTGKGSICNAVLKLAFKVWR
jgi:hypothetical protein